MARMIIIRKRNSPEVDAPSNTNMKCTISASSSNVALAQAYDPDRSTPSPRLIKSRHRWKQRKKYIWGALVLLFIAGGSVFLSVTDVRFEGEKSYADEAKESAISTFPSDVWHSFDWKQQGQNITGEAREESTGKSVALSADGKTLAIGAPYSNKNGIESGQVRIYHRQSLNDSDWVQIGQSIIAETAYSQLGWSVALSGDGNTLAIGAPVLWDYHLPGYAEVYRLGSEERWHRRGKPIKSETTKNSLGWSVSLSSDGDILAIGSPWSNDTGKNSGQVQVHRWHKLSRKYKQLGQNINGQKPYEESGSSVALSADGKTLVVGSPYNHADNKPGFILVHVWNKWTSSYIQKGGLIFGEESYDSAGYSVALSGDGKTLAVGAPYISDNLSRPGIVKVYQWDEDALTYKQLGDAIIGEEADDRSGRSVALSSEGKTLAIGAPWHGENRSLPGIVKVYRWDNDSFNYKQIGRSILGDAARDFFGDSVSLSADGSVLAIGATGSSSNGQSSGQVRVFSIEH